MIYIKKFILILFLIITVQNVYAYDNYSSDALDKLSFIERSLFGSTGSGYDYETRLKNAERKVFGASQSGDFNARINLLSNIIDSSNQNYNYTFSTKGYTTNTPFRIIRNALIQRQGVITGFTPPLYPVYTQNSPERRYYHTRVHKKFPPKNR